MSKLRDPHWLLGVMVLANVVITLWAIWSSCIVEG